MRMLLLSLLMPLFLCSPAAASEPPAMVRNAPDSADLPGEDQVYLEKAVDIRILPDGRRSIRVRTVRKLFTDYAVRRLSDPRIRYDKSTEDLEIHAHHVWTPDGKRLDAPAYARNESQADGVGRTVDFASVVELVATQVGSQRGAVLVLDYEITSLAPHGPPALDMELALGEEARVLRVQVSISVPTSLPFHTIISPADHRISYLGPELLATDTIHRWTGTDLPAWPREPGGNDDTPRLLVSTWDDWPAALGALETRVRTAWSAREYCDLASRIEESAGGPGFPRAWTAIRQGLRLVTGLDLHQSLAPRDACRAWETGYATPLETALVLASTSVTSEDAAVFLSTGDRALVSEVPGVAQLRKILVELRIPGAGSPLIIDPLRGKVSTTLPRRSGTGLVELRLSSPTSQAPGVLAPVLSSRDRPCASVDEERTYTMLPGRGLRLSLRVSLLRRPDVWLRLVGAPDLEAAVAAAVTPLLPGGRLVRFSVAQLSVDGVCIDAVIESDIGPEASARVPLGLAFPWAEKLTPLLSSMERTAPAAFHLCTDTTQRLKVQGLRALGLPGPRQGRPEGPATQLPSYRIDTEPGELLRVLQADEALVATEAIPSLRATLGAWQQDETRTFLLMPQGKSID